LGAGEQAAPAATTTNRASGRALARASGWATRAVRALETTSAGWIALAVTMAAAGIVFLLLTRGTTFWIDELYFFAGDKGFDPQYLLAPHNGQLILVPRLIYAAVFKLFGPDYLVFRLIELAGVLLVAGLVYALARRRVGGALALAPAVLLLFFGSSWSVVLPATGIINVYCVAAGLAAILVLEDGGRWADPVAALLLAISLSCWSPGLAFAAGAAVLILRQPDRWRRLWVAAVPLGLFALWWVTKPGLEGPLYGYGVGAKASNVLLIPNFIVDSTGSTLAALTGLNYGFSQPAVALAGPTPDYAWGPVLALLALAALVVALRRSRPSRWPWHWFAVLIVFWVSTALVALPALRTPSTGRYLYVVAAVLLVLAAAAVGPVQPRPRLVLIGFAATLLALGANVAMLRDGGIYLRSYAKKARADFTAIELARRYVSPTFVPTTGSIASPLVIPATVAGTYLRAVDRIGSFADTLPELRSAPEADREEADQILAQALGLHLAPAAPRSRASGCRRAPASAGAAPGLRLPGGGALLRSAGRRPARISLRRFASSFTISLGSLAPRRYYSLKIPTDAAGDPWRAQLVPAEPIAACPP
jgi:hypothetical protein